MKNQNGIARQLGISVCVLGVILLVGLFMMRHARSEAQAASAPTADPATQVSDAGKRILSITTVPVRMETLDNDLQATGVVSYPAEDVVKVAPRLSGRVRQVFARVGDAVTAGQLLAVMDSVDAATAQTTAIESQNKFRLAQANLQRVEKLYQLGTPEVTQAGANLEQAREHTQFTRDALTKLREQAEIGGFTAKPVEDAMNSVVVANSALAQARADLSQAQKDYERKVKLVDIGVASRSDLEASDDVYEKAKVSVEAGQQQLDLAHQALTREQKAFKTNLYAEQQIRSGENDYRQAQLQETAAATALDLTKAAVRTALDQARSDYQGALADANNSRRALQLLGNPGVDGSLRITAPSAGVVVERDVNPGQVVDQSQMTPWQMFVISNASAVWVEADVYEKDIESVAPGQRVQIRISALPGRVYPGRILHISPVLDPKTRAVKVRAEIDNRKGELKDGMFAMVTILRPHGRQAIIVPAEAILHDTDQDYVYVDQGGKYLKRQVRLGAQRGEMCEVLTGLKSGDNIVAHGALFLGDQSNSD